MSETQDNLEAAQPGGKPDVSALPVPEVYTTGSGSPISNVFVVDASGLDADQLREVSTGDRAGTIRLYRGIGRSFEQGTGSNYFSGEPDIALDYAHSGHKPTIVMVDIQLSDFSDLMAYRNLQGVVGQRGRGFSEGGFTSIQLPHDWLGSEPADQTVYRDMQGLDAHVEAQEARLGDWKQLLNARYEAEVNLAHAYQKQTGNSYSALSRSQEFDLQNADPGYQAAQKALKNYHSNREAIYEDIAKTLPSLNAPGVGEAPVIEGVDHGRVALGVAGVAGAALLADAAYEAVRHRKEGQSAAGALGDMALNIPHGIVESTGVVDIEKGDLVRAAAAVASTAATAGVIQGAAWIDNLRGMEGAKNVSDAQAQTLLNEFHSDKKLILHNAEPMVERIHDALKMKAEGAASVEVITNPLNGDFALIGRGSGVTTLTANADSPVVDMPIDDFIQGAVKIAIAKGISRQTVQGAYDQKAFDDHCAEAVLANVPDATMPGYERPRTIEPELNRLIVQSEIYMRERGKDATIDNARYDAMRLTALSYLDNGGTAQLAQRELGKGSYYVPTSDEMQAAGLSKTFGLSGDHKHDGIAIQKKLVALKFDFTKADTNGDQKISVEEMLARLSPQSQAAIEVQRACMAQAGVNTTVPSVPERPMSVRTPQANLPNAVQR